MFWRFLGSEHELGVPLDPSYDFGLVALSIVVAAMAGYTALTAAHRVEQASSGQRQLIWLATGGVTMGIGVWAMHFIAMLAMSLPVDVGYDPVITGISVLPAILGSAGAVWVTGASTVSHGRVWAGALAMATGIGGMHYIGMEAMVTSALLRYDLVLFIASIVVAKLLALGSLYARFRISSSNPRHIGTAKVGAAILLGFSVVGMHYTAMYAAYFFPAGDSAINYAAMPKPVMIALTVLVGVSVMALTIVTNLSHPEDERPAEASLAGGKSY